MFFSLLYLFTILAIIAFTILIIVHILRGRSTMKWLAWLAGVTLFYLLAVWVTAAT